MERVGHPSRRAGIATGKTAMRAVAAMVLTTAFAILVAGCGQDKTDSALGFRWPASSRAAVEVASDDGGEITRTRFTLELVAGPVAGESQVVISDFDVVAVGAADMNNPGVRRGLAPMLALGRSTPSVIVSSDGEFLRLGDWEAAVERMKETLTELDPTLDEDTIRETTEMMNNPAVRDRLQGTMVKDWRLWAGEWHSRQVSPGEEIEYTYAQDLPWGGQSGAPAILTFAETESAAPTDYSLQLQVTSQGPGFRQDVIQSMINAMPTGQREDEITKQIEDTIKSCAMRYDASVTIDPATSRPLTASSTEIFTIERTDGKTENQTKRKTFTFTWE